MESRLPQKSSRPLEFGELRGLATIRPGRLVLATSLNWACLILAATAAVMQPHWSLIILAALVIGNRQYALLNLVHEASHYLFSTDRRRNDRWANWSCAYPIGISVERYRQIHLEHHRHLGTEDDPDFHYYRDDVTRGWFARTVLFGLCGGKAGLTALCYFLPGVANRIYPGLGGTPSSHGSAPARGQLLGIAVAQGAIFMCFLLAGHPLLYGVVWLVPLLTIVPLTNHIRTALEHHSLDGDATTRTILAGLPGRIALAPHCFNYHLEHHLYPTIPYYNLRAVHRRLSDAGYYRDPADRMLSSYLETVEVLLRGASAEHATPPGTMSR